MGFHESRETIVREQLMMADVDVAHSRFDLVTICPPYVLGPIIHQASSPDSLNTCERLLTTA